MLLIQSQNLRSFAGTIINFAFGSFLIGDSAKSEQEKKFCLNKIKGKCDRLVAIMVK